MTTKKIKIQNKNSAKYYHCQLLKSQVRNNIFIKFPNSNINGLFLAKVVK